MRKRRYEILLPLTHNDGRPVSPDKFQHTFTVDVEDIPENQHFLADYKKMLLERFEQIEIYMVSFPVEII